MAFDDIHNEIGPAFTVDTIAVDGSKAGVIKAVWNIQLLKKATTLFRSALYFDGHLLIPRAFGRKDFTTSTFAELIEDLIGAYSLFCDTHNSIPKFVALILIGWQHM